MNWSRVTRSIPCPICRKPDWCGLSADGLSACCMRVESGRPARNGGWIHRIADGPGVVTPPPPIERAPEIDAARIISKWKSETSTQAVHDFAAKLSVLPSSIIALSACWSEYHRAWAFPMHDGQGASIGVRLRNDAGRKWAVRGSRSGIFVPRTHPQDMALICEGPTDTAAALSIGFFALGRPSCSQGAKEIHTTCLRLGIRRIVIIADNDGPGLQGASRIASEIPLPAKIWVPPMKDIRAFVGVGGTRTVIESEIGNQIWKRHGG